jgi:hypothetical protein
MSAYSRTSVFSLLIATVLITACNNSGEINVKNLRTDFTIENIYWGEVYLGGNLKAGQETGLVKIKRSDEKLPASNPLYFSIESSGVEAFVTAEFYHLDKDDQLLIVIADTTVIHELPDKRH